MPGPVLAWRERMIGKAGIRLGETQRVLDVGCGDAGDCMLFAGKARQVVGVDFHSSDNWTSVMAENLHFAVADGCRLPFPDECFDVVFEKDALHHVEDQEGLLAEMRRVSRKGGQVVIIEANRYNPILYLHMTLMEGHQHITEKRLRRLMESTFEKVDFLTIESHVYPTTSKIVLAMIHFLEDMLGKMPFVKHYLSYNIAVIDR